MIITNGNFLHFSAHVVEIVAICCLVSEWWRVHSPIKKGLYMIHLGYMIITNGTFSFSQLKFCRNVAIYVVWCLSVGSYTVQSRKDIVVHFIWFMVMIIKEMALSPCCGNVAIYVVCCLSVGGYTVQSRKDKGKGYPGNSPFHPLRSGKISKNLFVLSNIWKKKLFLK